MATTKNAPILFDAWTSLDYKNVIAGRNATGTHWLAADWTGEHRRRIQAYAVLTGYRDNAARVFMEVLNDPAAKEAADTRREYGDAALLIEQIRAAVIGDQQVISVDRADEYDENDPGQEPELAFAARRQDDLRNWAESERFTTKIIETERNATTFGDGVYSLGWDPRRSRPVLRTWDPGCYFPVLTEESDNEYPERVHLAWEMPEDEDQPAGKVRVHRITYELREEIGENGEPVPYTVPWSDEPVTKRCFMSDGIWEIDSRNPRVDDLTPERAVWTTDAEGPIEDRFIGIDFIPVVHIPNTVSLNDHYGRSALASVMQILDDIAATDSDLQAAAALTGGPMLALSGSMIDEQISVGPRLALRLGEHGSATMLDGAAGLGALEKYRDGLLSRLSSNGRVPEAMMGRVKPGEVQAGIVLSLSFAPMASLIDEMRLVRRDKYRILLKFVQRFYMLDGAWEGPEMVSDLVFGSYLPSDQAGTVTQVAQLYSSKLISRRTALKMLQEVGVPIDDPAAEESEIDRRDYEAANALLDATGNDQAVSEMLGVDATRPAPPTINPAPVPPIAPEIEEPEV